VWGKKLGMQSLGGLLALVKGKRVRPAPESLARKNLSAKRSLDQREGRCKQSAFFKGGRSDDMGRRSSFVDLNGIVGGFLAQYRTYTVQGRLARTGRGKGRGLVKISEGWNGLRVENLSLVA